MLAGLAGGNRVAAASFMSFPVAAFFSVTILVVALSSGTLSNVVEQGGTAGENHETGAVQQTPVDLVVLPIFKSILWVVNLVEGFSPIDSLSTGRSITWGQLGLAGLMNIVVLGGLVGGFAWWCSRAANWQPLRNDQ